MQRQSSQRGQLIGLQRAGLVQLYAIQFDRGLVTVEVSATDSVAGNAQHVTAE